VLALQGIIFEKGGEKQAAFSKLEESISLAKTQGCIRLFIDLFPGLEHVLQRMLKENTEVEYINKILKAKPQKENGKTQIDIQSVSTELDPLSMREIEVLKKLSLGLRNKEIADQLNIAPETVKSHLKNINSKLNVSSRIHAVKKATELGIIEIY